MLAISLISLYAAAGVWLSEIALKLFLPYIVLYASVMSGTGSRLKQAVGDLSYGTYLIGFPAILSVIAVDGKLGIYSTFAIAAAASLIFAWLSWHFVEQPCLRLKLSLQMRKA